MLANQQRAREPRCRVSPRPNTPVRQSTVSTRVQLEARWEAQTANRARVRASFAGGLRNKRACAKTRVLSGKNARWSHGGVS